MFSEGFSFPHPVLGLDDDIEGRFTSTIKVTRQGRKQVLSMTHTITNPYIERLVNENKAAILLQIYCGSTFKTWSVLNPGNAIEIDENDLCNKADVQPLIVATSKISNYSDGTFNDHYKGHSFTVEPNEIIALAGKLVLTIDKEHEKLGLANIFKFFAHEEDGKPIEFTFNQDKIHIQYSRDRIGNHPHAGMFKVAPWTAFNIFIVPALTQAFTLIKKDPEGFEEFEWFTALTSLVPEEHWQDEPYVNAQVAFNKGLPMLKAYEELTQEKMQ